MRILRAHVDITERRADGDARDRHAFNQHERIAFHDHAVGEIEDHHRHEQREGRVDRFGQDKPEVRVITYYGKDNPIDGVILEVLIRKHKSIKSDLGVTVAIPGTSEQIAETLFEGAIFREMSRGNDKQMKFDFEEKEIEQVEIQIKYEGYIKKAMEKVEKLRRMEAKRIPERINYEAINGLATEAKQKLVTMLRR